MCSPIIALVYGPEDPYRDASFSFQQFKCHAPRNFGNRVYKGKTHTYVDQNQTYLELCAPFRSRNDRVFLPPLASPGDGLKSATPRQAPGLIFSNRELAGRRSRISIADTKSALIMPRDLVRTDRNRPISR
jgi:hypothetical protein